MYWDWTKQPYSKRIYLAGPCGTANITPDSQRIYLAAPCGICNSRAKDGCTVSFEIRFQGSTYGCTKHNIYHQTYTCLVSPQQQSAHSTVTAGVGLRVGLRTTISLSQTNAMRNAKARVKLHRLLRIRRWDTRSQVHEPTCALRTDAHAHASAPYEDACALAQCWPWQLWRAWGS